MNDSSRLDVLRKALSCGGNYSAQHKHFIIEELDASATIKKVTIEVALSSDSSWFCFYPDKGRGKEACMSPLLSNLSDYSHHRACDCVLILLLEGVLNVIYFDLKSSKPAKFVGQFKSTRQFVRYLLGLCDDLNGVSFGKLEEKFVIICSESSLSMRKTTTKRSTGEGKSTPDSPFKKIISNGSALYLKEFLTKA